MKYRGYRWFLLFYYWYLLTQSLLHSNPWDIFGQTLASQPLLDTSFEPFSWCLHLSAYGLLAVLIRWATSRPEQRAWQLLFLYSAVAHGLATEWLQLYIPNRWPGVGDAVFNTLGVWMGGRVLRLPEAALVRIPAPFR